LEIFSQLISFQKELLSQIVKQDLETEVHSLEPQELQLLLLDILMMVKRQESDFHLEQERLFKVNAEPW
jgi:hypothetical protein